MDRRVNAVVLNYNHSADTLRCAEELRASIGIEVDVLVVDCASAPSDQQKLAHSVPVDHLLLLPSNVGYAGGMNAGIRFWYDRFPDAPIMLVTPDARVEPSVAQLLWQALASNHTAGAAGPVIIYREAPKEKIGAGGEITPGRLTLHNEVRGAEPYDVGWIEGCCVMLRPAALQAIGGLYEDYFLYFEDADLCLQLKRAGWRVLLVPGAYVRHLKPVGQQPPHYYYYNARNSYRFWSRNFRIPARRTVLRVAADTLWLSAIALACVFLPGRWRELPGRWRDARLALKGSWSGTRDHFSGRYGPRETKTPRA